MIFNSFEYITFFALILGVYWQLRSKILQNALLLAGSYFFYGYIHSWFLVLILFVTLVHYVCAIGIHTKKQYQKIFLSTGVVLSLGTLGIFKYYNFFIENIIVAAASVGWQIEVSMLHVLLPIGISFYTFQTLSYTIDVYRGRIAPEKNLLHFALYIAFFPQLIAGPIERASHLLPQINKERSIKASQFLDGLSLFMWGFVKKIVIADNISIIASRMFYTSEAYFPMVIVGLIAFSLQIYADFSGYVDIARGSARMLGFNLVHNFNNPYLAHSPQDFWRRWHISLSDWVRDYVYIPLGGSRRGFIRNAMNVLITFFLVGLWHGASWNFVLWGLYWGILILLHRAWQTVSISARPSSMYKILSIVCTYCMTTVGWLLFFETDMVYVFYYFTLSPFGIDLDIWQFSGFLLVLTILYASPMILHMFYDEYLRKKTETTLRVRFALQVFGICISAFMIFFLHGMQTQEFIYFQF